MAAPIRVCVTGAAGQIAYSLLGSICKGEVFGADQPVILQLLDIAPALEALQGVLMELEDCAFPLLAGVIATAALEEAFKDVDYAILLGGMPRKDGMERKDLLFANAKIFQVQGKAIDTVAKKTVKILVVANPANTNAYITSQYAPSIPKGQISCLTFLDMNRARTQIAIKAGCNPLQVKNVIIWGNHSATQYPDVSHAFVQDPSGAKTPVLSALTDHAFLEGPFIKLIQTRGAAVIKARKLSSAMSAAKAVADHVRTWAQGTAPGEYVSMGVVSDGSYGIEEGLVYSFPVTIAGGVISIVKGLEISAFSRTKMDQTRDELLGEREDALAYFKSAL